MKFTKHQIKEYFEWDVINWSKALTLWAEFISGSKMECLELGSNKGGLSLMLAQNGHSVVCSDLENPKELASEKHNKVLENTDLIQYEAINAKDIPYEDHFDLVIFKSILGGIGRNNDYKSQEEVITTIHRSLKKDGILIFAENLKASSFHRIFRNKFTKWGSVWRYITTKETVALMSIFSDVNFRTCGFLGAFGRNERQRNFLGKIDSLIFDKILPNNMRYIVYGYAKK